MKPKYQRSVLSLFAILSFVFPHFVFAEEDNRLGVEAQAISGGVTAFMAGSLLYTADQNRRIRRDRRLIDAVSVEETANGNHSVLRPFTEAEVREALERERAGWVVERDALRGNEVVRAELEGIDSRLQELTSDGKPMEDRTPAERTAIRNLEEAKTSLNEIQTTRAELDAKILQAAEELANKAPLREMTYEFATIRSDRVEQMMNRFADHNFTSGDGNPPNRLVGNTYVEPHRVVVELTADSRYSGRFADNPIWAPAASARIDALEKLGGAKGLDITPEELAARRQTVNFSGIFSSDNGMLVSNNGMPWRNGNNLYALLRDMEEAGVDVSKVRIGLHAPTADLVKRTKTKWLFGASALGAIGIIGHDHYLGDEGRANIRTTVGPFIKVVQGRIDQYNGDGRAGDSTPPETTANGS